MKLIGQPREKNYDGWKFSKWKSMFARWRGWLFIQLYESICVGFWRFLEGSQHSQWSSQLKIFILDSWVDGGGYFIQCEVFQALPGGKRSRGSIGAFRSLKSQSMAEIFLARELMGGVHSASVTRIPPLLNFKKKLPFYCWRSSCSQNPY